MTQFRITYDGPALATHQMDARELAPALMAMADLLDCSVRALHADRAKAQINVKGSFKTGSFSVDFTTSVSFMQAAKDIFVGDGVTAIANATAVLTALGFAAKAGYSGVAQVLQWLRGRRITDVQMTEEGRVRLHADKDTVVVDYPVLVLLRDIPVRQAFDRTLAPLDRDGIDTFAAGDDSSFAVIVREHERRFFCAPTADDELLLEDTCRMAFSIVSLAFKEDNKWRLSDGNHTISARISDERFHSSVDANESSFSKGDVLICEVKVTQWHTPNGAKTDYEVTRVIEHRRAACQISLPGMQRISNRVEANSL
ncbi:hypothetical protein PDM28_16690 [Stenotrophomonas aracearum]|uniref:Uncharacterized protein n=1 Tax=Stenotrophomonas aracearum TaxID=3003272 RepID=A0ABY9YBP3_9GAMM|nr:hypothetical protein [Stenotrophomonas sp. A5588]WNH48287.1 hypothetical protein PDM28_16690 [Stenotrophomonas sp. A5588]